METAQNGQDERLFRGGVPSLLRQGLQSAATVFINHLAGAYGDVAIAAISMVNRVAMIVRIFRKELNEENGGHAL
jgi:Na+-driven multidrug efflux pump